MRYFVLPAEVAVDPGANEAIHYITSPKHASSSLYLYRWKRIPVLARVAGSLECKKSGKAVASTNKCKTK